LDLNLEQVGKHGNYSKLEALLNGATLRKRPARNITHVPRVKLAQICCAYNRD